MRAVDQINQRQRFLDEGRVDLAAPAWPPRPSGIAFTAERRAQNEIEVQIANLTREVAAIRQATALQKSELSSDPIIGELRERRGLGRENDQSIGTAGETAALEKRLDDLGSRIDALRSSGANEEAIRWVEKHVAEVVRSIGAGTHRELSTISTELKSVGAKLDQIAVQQQASARRLRAPSKQRCTS